MLTEKNNIHKEQDMLERKKLIINTAYAYLNNKCPLRSLAILLEVSENTLATWFCEAISEKYITSDITCRDIMRKHIAEYESYHNIQNSSLRVMYKQAFKKRRLSSQGNK